MRLTGFCRIYLKEILFSALVAFGVAVMYFADIGCFFKSVTGIGCITCGITRAYISLLSGDISAAFYYHPLFLLIVPLYLVLFFRRKFSQRFVMIFALSVIAAFIAVYIARLFFIPDSLIYIGH